MAATIATTSAATLLSSRTLAAETTPPLPVTFSLNTSTIRGQALSVPDQIGVAADAGYEGIEPWIRDVRAFVDGGGKVSDLKRQLDERGLRVVSAIGFAKWIVDDSVTRAEGLDEARRDMELVRALGGDHIAAPPIGAHQPGLDQPSLPVIADRYRALCEVGEEVGVYPQLELWGFSPTLHTLGELAYVATAAAHDRACVLPDFYHIYKGGNDFRSLSMIEASKMHCFHINDYPAEPSLETIADKDRVFPGDGVCDLTTIIAELIGHGFTGVFSLELFNPDYWKRDALEVATEGLQKSRRVVASAVAGKEIP